MMKVRFFFVLYIYMMSAQLIGAATMQEQHPDSIQAVMKRVADWQIKDYPNNVSRWTHTPTMWTNGVLYVGIAEFASIWKDDSYYEWLRKVGQKERWHPDKGMYFADDVCISQLYCQLYEKYKDKQMLQPTEARLQWVMSHPSKAAFDYYAPGSHERWCWCDALFMAPTVYARMAAITSDKRYLEFMEQEFWATVDLLYDKQEFLFFRDTRYITMREKNGEKVFWGRGNGWVVGALAVIIDQLPQDYPTRGKYISLFREIMEKVVTLQDANGFWHASMLDPEAYPMPESSSSAFFTYGLAWGMNRGILPARQFKSYLDKGWSALLGAVHPDGKLGWVQTIGSDPQSVSYETSEVYGVGAFLLAGVEVYKMSMNHIEIDRSDSGLRFEGVGAVSAGASSRLLKDYPEPYRSDILDYLFKPGFGASLQHFKFEVGGDINSTCGTEPAHARSREEMLSPRKKYFERGYESWMASEAIKRSCDINLDILQWGAPGWFTGGFYSRDNADFIVSYIKGLKRYYGLEVDYCGLWNEKHIPAASRNYVVDYLRPALDKAGLKHVKIVGNDMYCTSPKHHQPWSYAEELRSDGALREAIDVLGYHYLTIEATPAAKELGMPIWESEASMLTGSWEHALKFVKNTNLNYIKSRAVKTILWNPVDAYYPNVSWNNIGMMEAKMPWCGYYEVRPAVWAVAHITQFVQPGWRYLDKACGETKDGTSYVTLYNDKSKNYSLIIAGGNRQETFTLSITNWKKGTLQVWKSNAAEQFIKEGVIAVQDGTATFTVEPNTVYTLTTTKGQQRGKPAHPIPGKKSFPTIYQDNFETYDTDRIPLYLSDQGGAFEVKQSPEGNKYLQQMITDSLICWDPWGANNPEPFTQFGEVGYKDYEVAVDVKIPSGGCASVYGRVFWFESNTAPHGVGFTLKRNGEWNLIVNQKIQETGSITLPDLDGWHRIQLSFLKDKVTVSCNKRLLGTYTLPPNLTKGMVGLGANRTKVCFDNLSFSCSNQQGIE